MNEWQGSNQSLLSLLGSRYEELGVYLSHFPFYQSHNLGFFLGGGKSCSAFQFESSHYSLTDQITKLIKVGNLVHPSNKPAVLVFSVTSMPTFNNMDDLFLHSNSGEDNLKGQEKIIWRASRSCQFLGSTVQQYRLRELDAPCRWFQL